MKKLILLCALICAGQLYGMERKPTSPVMNPNGNGRYQQDLDQKILPFKLEDQLNSMPTDLVLEIRLILLENDNLYRITCKLKEMSKINEKLNNLINNNKLNDVFGRTAKNGILALVNTLANRFPYGTLSGDLAELEKNNSFDKEDLIRLAIARDLSENAAQVVSNFIGFDGPMNISRVYRKGFNKSIWADVK